MGCFENTDGIISEYITFEELMDLFQAYSPKKSHLQLVLDCCHSGAWADKIQTHRVKDRVTIYASCRANELSSEDELGGYFLKDFIEHELWCVPYLDTPTLFTMNNVFDKSYDGEQHPQAWHLGQRWGL